MASLRKRPTDVDAEVVADNNPPAISTEPDAPSGPASATAPLPEQDAASEALKAQVEALRQSETMHQQAQVAMQVAKQRRDAWLASTPGARENIGELGRIHHAALDAGLADTSPEYFSFLESELAALNSKKPAEAASRLVEGMQELAERSRTPEPPLRSSSSLYSAPVSRDIPDATGSRHGNRKVTLTPAEIEMARVSGVSVEEYGRQKLKLQMMKASGEYSETGAKTMSGKMVVDDPNTLANIVVSLGGTPIPGRTFRFDLPLSEVNTVVPKLNQLGVAARSISERVEFHPTQLMCNHTVMTLELFRAPEKK